jgi:azurin
MKLWLARAIAALIVGLPAFPTLAEDAGKIDPIEVNKRVSLDKSAKIVAFQLKRLKNPELLVVERKTDDPKYKPVYEAILVRPAMERKHRQEAATALAAINKSDPVVEILAGIGAADKDDSVTQSDLVGLLLTQKPAALAAQKTKIESIAKESPSTSLKEAAYAALVVADGKPDAVWESASKDPSSLALLLGGVGMIPDEKLRAAFYERVKPLTAEGTPDAVRVAAIDALGFIPGHEAESFGTLAALLNNERAEVRGAAVRSIRRIPADTWPKRSIDAVANGIVKTVREVPGDKRAAPDVVEMIQFGEELAGALPPAQGTPLRKSLRELGVRTVLVRTLKEQMAYDLRYFVVQAGKPVQVILDNPDAMPHNFVVTLPGAVADVGTTGGAMQPPTDPNVKPFVPDSPKVLHATHLVQPGKSETLAFEAPREPGEYGYVCTFPGHWVRMYGVMLVVRDLDAYDAKPTAPTDPVTKKPFESSKQTASDLPPAEHAH